MLHFQSAGAESGYLLEHLLIESIGAKRGGGIYAWANTAGIRTLISDPIFIEFLKDANFRLYVGLDSITDVAAIDALDSLASQYWRLDVRAFLNPGSGLFHPKLSWFESNEQLTLVIGSGNLTMGGLKNNWEAFTVTKLTGDQAALMLDRIEAWLTTLGPNLLPLSDSRVRERAAQNTGSERNLKREPVAHSPTPVIASETNAILVAEIPRSGDRWAQANFDRDHYENFFGAAVGSQRRIVLYNVEQDGRLGNVESRPSVEVASQNYRFELAAAKNIPYPSDGRPIGVFFRLNTGDFLYQLILPDDPGYSELEALLTSHFPGSSPHHMRRIDVSVDALRAAWPNSPLWIAGLPPL
jgi:hypothetical protein